MPERRYSDDEVAEIFRRATVPRPGTRAPLASAEGMTLAQLEAIAVEAGIEASQIAVAARELDAPPAAPRRAVGVPVSVSRSVELPRELSDREWEHLVTRLRETFDAAGKLEVHGTLKQWSNGNLRVMLEPGIRGHRVRFTTLHAGVQARLVGGALVAAFGLTTTVVAAFYSGDAGWAAFGSAGILGLLGALVATAAGGAAARWRRERRSQFDALATELERLAQGN